MATGTFTWTTTDSYDPDEPCTVTRAEALVARDWRAAERAFQVEFAEASTASASYATLVTREIYIPDWAVGLYLVATVEVKVSAAGSGRWRLYNSDRSVAGDTLASAITSTTYVDSTNYLLIDSTDSELVRTILVEGTATAGTFFARNENRISFRFAEQYW